ncbi:MAG: methylmalonyl-CoA epimerase [Tissierellia bacterium]|jgi:methylmalonyl-CoA/ethylmalonyl-CoA epimerase|nr:methylmalonyl-CoA epimerase [Bacillota bacterium]NLL22325.1 methylmalonyl-CoA epimerase [Tissierellia bacterium]
MKILKLDHIGIAVKDLDEALPFWRDVMGLEPAGTEIVEEQKVKVAFLPVGDTEIELLESTDDSGPIARFIEKNGEGVQHLAFRVDDIEEGIAYMKAQGMRMIDEKPRYGAGGAKIAFVHPKSSKGVLVEISERK